MVQPRYCSICLQPTALQRLPSLPLCPQPRLTSRYLTVTNCLLGGVIHLVVSQTWAHVLQRPLTPPLLAFSPPLSPVASFHPKVRDELKLQICLTAPTYCTTPNCTSCKVLYSCMTFDRKIKSNMYRLTCEFIFATFTHSTAWNYNLVNVNLMPVAVLFGVGLCS